MRYFTTRYLLLFLCILTTSSHLNAQNKHIGYLALSSRHVSLGNQIYYIDPGKGNDNNNGLTPAGAWKTFSGVNQLILSPGDGVTVLSPGAFHETLAIVARGTLQKPVNIRFAPGEYNLFPDGAFKTTLQISNTNDVPDGLKAIALMVDSSSFLNISGVKAIINMRGKMIETYINSSDHIKLNGLGFDYYRPTVSEFKVLSIKSNYADVMVAGSSWFSVKDSTLMWLGEGWNYRTGSYWQVYAPATSELSRIGIPQGQLRYVQLGGQNLRIFFSRNPGFEKGSVYQNRDVTRDCAGIFIQKSSNIGLNHIRIYFMHGMGVVSQFSENLRFNHLVVKPRKGRTSASWADILHFSGCSGKIEIANSYLSAANDDAINVHGTFLKITERLSSTQIKVRFMHDQTYGFDAFSANDSVNLVHTASLLTYQNNKVLSVVKLNNKEFLLRLSESLFEEMQTGDVIENTSAMPQVWIHRDTIEKIPTRGILVTTPRKIIIEHNVINRTCNSAIMINDDASSWYESGAVRDVTINNNVFYECGGPVIAIHPENKITSSQSVHQGIKIFNNNIILLRNTLFFDATSTSGIRLTGNALKSPGMIKKFDELTRLKACSDLNISGNVITASK